MGTTGEGFLPHLVSEAFSQIMTGLGDWLAERGYDDLRATHFVNVLRLLDCGGTRPADLARRAGITPQAMGELIGHLERAGYVTRTPDPSDGRARLVVWGERGRAASEDAAGYFAQLQQRWQDALGADGLSTLTDALATVVAAGPTRGRARRP